MILKYWCQKIFIEWSNATVTKILAKSFVKQRSLRRHWWLTKLLTVFRVVSKKLQFSERHHFVKQTQMSHIWLTSKTGKNFFDLIEQSFFFISLWLLIAESITYQINHKNKFVGAPKIYVQQFRPIICCQMLFIYPLSVQISV